MEKLTRILYAAAAQVMWKFNSKYKSRPNGFVKDTTQTSGNSFFFRIFKQTHSYHETHPGGPSRSLETSAQGSETLIGHANKTK